MDKLGTALGTGLNFIGQNVPQFLGGPQANWGSAFIPPNAAEVGGAMQYSTDPGISSYFGADPSSTPEALAGPIATAVGPTGGVGANPAQLTESAFSAFPQATDPVTGGQLGPALGDPASSTTANVLAALGIGGSAGGAAGGKSAWPGALSLLASGGIDIAKYLQQRSLLDQNSLQKAEQNALKGQKAALERNVFPGVQAQLQETGNINAPYLETQAYTAAIAPYVQSQEQAAMENWLRANALAEGLYPTDLGNPLGGFVSPNIFGGGGSA